MVEAPVFAVNCSSSLGQLLPANTGSTAAVWGGDLLAPWLRQGGWYSAKAPASPANGHPKCCTAYSVDAAAGQCPCWLMWLTYLGLRSAV
jgi:hypothetical protein